ncbi:MAG: sulfotransferase, partial [Sphingomonadales bacterium]
VGMPRSGTSLTDQIFATHSDCFGGDELQYFTKYLNRMTSTLEGEKGILGYTDLKMEHLEQVSTLYQRRVQTLSPGSHYISDKMPWNYQVLGMISKVLPWAKIIHIHRDPLDCGLSCYRNPLPNNLEFTCDMEDYAFYRAKYQELMDFWQKTIPERFINLSYEELVDNPEKELRRVLDYCGLPWEDELLNFHKTKRQVRTISSDQVNKPLNKSSIGRAMKYEKELAPMISALEKYGLIPR